MNSVGYERYESIAMRHPIDGGDRIDIRHRGESETVFFAV